MHAFKRVNEGKNVAELHAIFIKKKKDERKG